MNFDLKKAQKSIIKVSGGTNSWGMGLLTECGFVSAAHCLPRIPDPNDLSEAVKVKIKNLSELESYALVSGVEPCLDLAILSDSSSSGIGVDLAPVEMEEYFQLLRNMEEAQIYLEEPQFDKEVMEFL